MSCISITKVPNCSLTDMCEDYKRAENMSFQMVYFKGYQFFSEKDIEGVTIKNPRDMPWNIRSDGFNIWPHILSNDLWFVGVYWPQKYEIMFIVNNGDPRSSAIAYNSIDKKFWWKHMKLTPLKSSIIFNGLFLLDDSIFAIGNGSILFKLIAQDGQRSLQYIVSIN